VDDARKVHSTLTSFGRIGETEEVAKVVAFLVSNDCSFVHGSDIFIDGGATL